MNSQAIWTTAVCILRPVLQDYLRTGMSCGSHGPRFSFGQHLAPEVVRRGEKAQGHHEG
jgi:hypothetical protein